MQCIELLVSRLLYESIDHLLLQLNKKIKINSLAPSANL